MMQTRIIKICGMILFYDGIFSKQLGKFKIYDGFVILACDLIQLRVPGFTYTYISFTCFLFSLDS